MDRGDHAFVQSITDYSRVESVKERTELERAYFESSLELLPEKSISRFFDSEATRQVYGEML